MAGLAPRLSGSNFRHYRTVLILFVFLDRKSEQHRAAGWKAMRYGWDCGWWAKMDQAAQKAAESPVAFANLMHRKRIDRLIDVNQSDGTAMGLNLS